MFKIIFLAIFILSKSCDESTSTTYKTTTHKNNPGITTRKKIHTITEHVPETRTLHTTQTTPIPITTKTRSSASHHITTSSITRTSSRTSSSSSTHTSAAFVTLDRRSGGFLLSGQKFVPVGFNAYWLGFTEEYKYPTHSQIEEMFIVAKRLGATVIRSHTLGFSGGSPNSLRPNDNRLNPAAWEPIDYSFSMAQKYNIKLIVPLIDAYDYYHGSYGEFCKTRGVPKDSFWTNMDVRGDFKEYINIWLGHQNMYTGRRIRDDPSLFLIELGNELGNIRPGVGSNTVPTREWIQDISQYIQNNAPNHLVLHGVDESLGQNDDFNINSIDVFSGHFYSKDYNRIDFGASGARSVNKPYIIGEYDSNFSEDWYREIESRGDVHGTLFWSMYPHTGGFGSGSPVPHNDGYTLHYPESDQLDRIEQHFTNMKTKA